MTPTIYAPDRSQLTLWLSLWIVLYLALLLPLVAGALLLQRAGADGLFGSMAVLWTIIALPALAWLPRYHRSLRYVIEEGELRVQRGAVWRRQQLLPYPKITNVYTVQGPLERLFGLGRLKVRTADFEGSTSGGTEVALVGLSDPEGAKSALLRAIRTHARQLDNLAGEELGGEASVLAPLLRSILQEIIELRKVMEGRRR